MPGQTLDEHEKYKFLAWNNIGSVAIKQHDSEDFSVIQIEFADKEFNKNTIIPNTINAKIGTLGF